MEKHVSRRTFTGTALAIASAGLAARSAFAQSEKTDSQITIVGVACSPREGMTTAVAVQEALNAAAAVDERVTTQLLDLGGMNISGWSPNQVQDDFNELLPVLKAENLGGLIIGTPVFFRGASSLCKAFLERLAALRKPKLLLAGKPVGALSVGAYRHGGQELAISEIHNAMLCHEAVVVGGKAGAFQGATLWNSHDDDIAKDEFGMDTARKLGARVAETALDS